MSALRKHPFHSRQQSPHHGVRPLDRRAVRQRHGGLREVRLNRRKETKPHSAACGVCDRDGEDTHGEGERDITMAGEESENGTVKTTNGAHESAAYELLGAIRKSKKSTVLSPSLMSEMRRQHEHALKQRYHKDRRHHNRYHAENLADHPRNEVKRHEGGDVRQDAEGDGHGDLARAAYRRLQKRHSFLSQPVYVLPHDYRVVHDDSHGDDVGEKRDHVETHIEGGQQKEGTEEGDRNAQHDPEGETRFQKQRQKDEHQYKSRAAVAQQKVDALAVDF